MLLLMSKKFGIEIADLGEGSERSKKIKDVLFSKIEEKAEAA